MNMKNSILIVDDEKKIRDIISMYLENDGFIVEQASDGQTALDKIATNNYSLIILDLMMPKIDGWDVCRQIRKSSDVPVIMLTARSEEIDRVLGLEMGADDYIVKPFSPREVLARVKAVLRRSNSKDKELKKVQRNLEFMSLSINPESREVHINGKDISLTPKEFELIYFLAQNPGRAFAREQLLQHVWGYDFYGDLRTVDTHINRLRDKLNREDSSHQFIVTVWGVGYKFEVSK